MAVQTSKISDLTLTKANPDSDFVELSRDNSNGTFSSFKAAVSDLGGSGVQVGQSVLQIAAMPLDPDYLRLDGGTYSGTTYPDIAGFFPSAATWSNGGQLDNTAPTFTSTTRAVCLSNDSTKLYVSEYGSGNVIVYDTDTWAILNTIIIASSFTTFSPQRIEISETGDRILLSVNRGGDAANQLIMINTQTDTVILEFDCFVGTLPDSIRTSCFNLSGNLIAYVSNVDNTSIIVYDISLGQNVSSIDTIYTSYSICFDYGTDNIITRIEAGIAPRLQIFNLSGNMVAGISFNANTAELQSNVFNTRKTSSYFYLTVPGGQVRKYSTTNLSLIGGVAIGSGGNPACVSESSDGDQLAVAVYNSDTSQYFFMLNESDLQTIPGFPVISSSLNCHISKGNKKIVVSGYTDGSINIIDQTGNVDDFIISDVASPDLTFEYRIKAK